MVKMDTIKIYTYSFKYHDQLVKIHINFDKFQPEIISTRVEYQLYPLSDYLEFNSKNVGKLFDFFDISYSNINSMYLDVRNQFNGKVKEPNKLLTNESILLGCKEVEKGVIIENTLTVFTIFNKAYDVIFAIIERQAYVTKLQKKLSRSFIQLITHNEAVLDYILKESLDELTN